MGVDCTQKLSADESGVSPPPPPRGAQAGTQWETKPGRLAEGRAGPAAMRRGHCLPHLGSLGWHSHKAAPWDPC